MKVTDDQRANNVASSIVAEIENKFANYRKFLKEGVPMQDPNGKPLGHLSAEKFRAALGEANVKELEIMCEFVLDGKSNKIVKIVKARKK